MARRITEDQLPTGLSEYDAASLYYRRYIGLVAKGELSHAVVVLEFLSSLVAAYDLSEFDPKQLLENLPVKKLREHTVEVPVEFLRVLAEPWQNLLIDPDGYTYSQRLGIDAKGQGKPKQIRKLLKLRRDTRYSNAVHVILADTKRAKPATVEEAIAEAAARFTAVGDEVSESTIKAAYNANHPDFVATVDALNNLNKKP